MNRLRETCCCGAVLEIDFRDSTTITTGIRVSGFRVAHEVCRVARNPNLDEAEREALAEERRSD